MSCEKVSLVCENDGEEDEKEPLDFKFLNSSFKKKEKNFRRREAVSDDESKNLEETKPAILYKGDRKIELK